MYIVSLELRLKFSVNASVENFFYYLPVIPFIDVDQVC